MESGDRQASFEMVQIKRQVVAALIDEFPRAYEPLIRLERNRSVWT